MITIEIPKDGSRPLLSAAPKLPSLLFSLTVVSTIYAGATRHWSDFLAYVPLCASPAFFGMTLLIAKRLLKGERSLNPLLGSLIILLICMFVGLFYYGLIVAAKDVFRWSDPRLTTPLSRAIFFGIAALLVGGGLFFFRSFARSVYGLHEAAVGVAIASYNAYRATGQPSTWDSGVYIALISAGAYLVVRGFDNIQQGIVKEPYDPFARDFFRASLDAKPTNPTMTKLTFYISDVFFRPIPEMPAETSPDGGAPTVT